MEISLFNESIKKAKSGRKRAKVITICVGQKGVRISR